MLAKKELREKQTIDLKVVESDARNSKKGISVLADGCTFQGKMFLQGEARLSGKIEGTIFSNGMLIIEESAHVTGDVIGAKILVCGKVEGTIQSNMFLQITHTARINGDLNVHRLVVDDGARINGRISYVEEGKKESTPTLTAVKK